MNIFMESFICPKCGTDTSDWYYSVRGRDSMCKTCRKSYRKSAKREYTKKYISEHKDAQQERMAVWRKENPEYQKQWTKNCPQSQLLRSSRMRAKQKGIECTITQDDIHIPDMCPVFNVPLQKNTIYAPSIDRLDNTKGYTPENIRVISRRANTMKNDGNLMEHIMLVEWMKQETTH